jgi:Lecithin:cholesterol acyltransferase
MVKRKRRLMTSIYDTGRNQEFLAKLKIDIDKFASKYACHPTRELIFLFPGGTGSQLLRAFAPSTSTLPFSYYPSWLSGKLLVGEAANLRIEASGEDYQDHYVIPDHEIGVDLLGLQLSSYEGFKAWCFKNKFHLFIFGFDWRRGVKLSADFFVNSVLPAFEAKIGTLKNFTLIGHSAGGMVVKIIANQSSNPYVQRMNRAITVATPFYGTGAQIQRFIKGMPILNATVPGHAKEMASICASMLGG